MTEPVTGRDRFATARSTLLVDRLMTSFISVGGIGIIIAVSLIFIFIFLQVLPLLRGARVEAVAPLPAGEAGSALALMVDEWGALPAVIDAEGRVSVLPADGTPARRLDSLLPAGETLLCAHWDGETQHLVAGTSRGRVALISPRYRSRSGAEGRQQVDLEPRSEFLDLGEAGEVLLDAAYGGKQAIIAAGIAAGAGRSPTVRAAVFTRKRTMLGGEALVRDTAVDLGPQLSGPPRRVLVDAHGESVVVLTQAGRVHYFYWMGEAFEHRQAFAPHEGPLASLDYVYGCATLVATSADGRVSLHALHRKPGSDVRQFGQVAAFEEPMPGGALTAAISVRNKSVVLAGADRLSLRYATTASVRWEQAVPYRPRLLALTAKGDGLAVLGDDGRLHRYNVADHHPEAGWRAFFGRLWYEGYDRPLWEWQSTGGTDDYEPKLSMVPLILGTLKGTLYALLFALPIAVLGALYTAEFMHPRFKAVIKPTVEIMASLPSVVLGFLAAQWLAPLVQLRVPSVIAVATGVPLAALAIGWFWSGLPPRWRSRVRPGYEHLVLLPVLLALVAGLWACGPLLERVLFAGDFRRWWQDVAGVYPDQRNALVVGIMMGFAVIPIIFTIAEDALANVPKALRSGSLALGASRWQTAVRIVLPTASAGIFSAAMIGLGRAIGETMIVVMATGNTPILSFDPFNGMRTLSANIAVEMPEAPVGGTLYRTLFLGALLLFLMTFVINTVAEVLRQHLRQKYKTV